MPRGSGAEWTCAEAGMAGCEVDRNAWYALRYSFAGDDTVRGSLAKALVYWYIRRRDRWAPVVWIRFRELVALHLDEERHASVFVAAPEIRPVILHVDPRFWERSLQPAYEDLRYHYLSWMAIGLRRMRAWLAEHPEDFDDAGQGNFGRI